MADAAVFDAYRPLLFSIAYRMLGTASDAEDVLQDAWLRLSSADETAIRSPKAFATTVVTRLCLDRLKSARATREEYVGPWLPEPVLTSGGEGPDVLAERAESVTLAFLLLLETLSPEERAVFLLKEVFEYEHGEIADMLGTTTANSRQLLHRAKARLQAARPPARLADAPRIDPADRAARRQMAERFAAAFSHGDGTRLTALLAADVSFLSDGGGKVSASRRPIVGRDAVQHFLVGIYRAARNTGLVTQASLRVIEVNAEPAIALRVGGQLDSVYVLSIEDGVIEHIRVVRNPDKLAFIDRQLATVM